MNKSILVFAVLTLSAAASAAQFKSESLAALRLMDGAAPDQASAPAASPKPAGRAKTFSALPRMIDCTGLDKESLRFYTRLEGYAPADLPAAGKTPANLWNGNAKADETAARLNDYRGAWATQKEFTYSVTSCDTTDYLFTFDLASMARTDSAQNIRKIKGHVKVETRGIVDDDKDLDCSATY